MQRAEQMMGVGLQTAMPAAILGNLSGVRFWEQNGSGQPHAYVARCGQLDRAQCPDQHMNTLSGPLFERSRGSGRRARSFNMAPVRRGPLHEVFVFSGIGSPYPTPRLRGCLIGGRSGRSDRL